MIYSRIDVEAVMASTNVMLNSMKKLKSSSNDETTELVSTTEKKIATPQANNSKQMSELMTECLTKKDQYGCTPQS